MFCFERLDLRYWQDKPGEIWSQVIGNLNVRVKWSGSNQNIGEMAALGKGIEQERLKRVMSIQEWRGELEKE